MDYFLFFLQLLGAMTLVFFLMFGLLRAQMILHLRASVKKWRREYETPYERDQRVLARKTMWKHRLHLPDLPVAHRASDLAPGEEDAIRRARTYYD